MTGNLTSKGQLLCISAAHLHVLVRIFGGRSSLSSFWMLGYEHVFPRHPPPSPPFQSIDALDA